MNLGYYETKDGKISFNETHFSYLYDVLKEYFAYNYAINQYQSRIICENHEFDYKENVPNKDYTYSQKLKAEVIEYVKQGIPVLVGLSGETTEEIGHAVIAYDYADVTENGKTETKLYGHFGWSDSSSYYVDLESQSYKYISAYMVLNISMAGHSHSNNYVMPAQNGNAEQKVCSCKLNCHAHEYISYKYYNSTKHKATCFCEDYSRLLAHDFRVVGNYYVCKDCNYYKPYDGGEIPVPITPSNIENDILKIVKEMSL